MGLSSWPRRRSGTPPLFLASHKRILDDVSDRILADAITCSRHACRTAWPSIPSKPCRKKGQSPTSVTGRRTRQRDSPEVLSSHRRLCGFFPARWQMGMPSCLRSGKRTPPAFWPSTRPYGGGICSHQHAAQVHDGAVIKFPKIPSKEEIIISVNEPQADAAARRSWCPVQRKKNCTPRRKKKKLHNWVSHQAAGRCRLPQRHHSWPPTTSNE